MNTTYRLSILLINVLLATGCGNSESVQTSSHQPNSQVPGSAAETEDPTRPTAPSAVTTVTEQDVVASIESMDGIVKRNEHGDVISVALVGSRSTQFRDQDLQRLAAFRHIELLNLAGCENLTDDGLRHLERFSALQTLFLNPKIGDQGLEHLGKMTNLRKLYLSDCDVTATAVEKLQLALPDCEVKR